MENRLVTSDRHQSGGCHEWMEDSTGEEGQAAQPAKEDATYALAQGMLKTNSAMISSMHRMCDALEVQNKFLKRLIKVDEEGPMTIEASGGPDPSGKKRKGRPPSLSTWKEYMKRYPSSGSIEHYSSLTQYEKNAIRVEAKRQECRDDEEEEEEAVVVKKERKQPTEGGDDRAAVE